MTEESYESRKTARLRDVFYAYLIGIIVFAAAVVTSIEVELREVVVRTVVPKTILSPAINPDPLIRKLNALPCKPEGI